MSCHLIDDIVICGPGATETIATCLGRTRWCFACRTRSPGLYELHREVEPSYYEPNWSYHCANCGADNRWGFGCWPDDGQGPDIKDGPVELVERAA